MAAPWNVVQEIESVLGSDFVVVGASTFEAAVHRASEAVDLIVICYVFDEMRPYRLLNHLKAAQLRAPVVLVRALNVPLQNSEQQIRESYAMLGIAEFFDVAEETSADGRAAAFRRFAQWVGYHVPRGKRAPN